MKRIYSLDLFKLYFAYVIAFGHFGGIDLPGASFAVKLFFVISGFFLARKFYAKSYIADGLFTSQNRYSHKNYTLDHIKQLFPHYLFSFLVMFIYTIAVSSSASITEKGLMSTAYLSARTAYSNIPELMLVQSSGFFGNGLNYPTWQISAIIICGYLIYTCMYYCEKLSVDLLFPAAFILFETYWIVGRDPFANIGCLPATLARGFAMMALGVIIYKFSMSDLYGKIKSFSVFYNLFSLFILAGMFIFERYNGVHIIAFGVIILYLYNPDSWFNRIFNRNIFKICGSLSYAIYLNHAFIIEIVHSIMGQQNTSFTACAVMFVSLTIYSLITIKITDIIKSRFKKI